MKKLYLLLIAAALIFLSAASVYAEDATSSSDSIRDKVQEKVTKALNSPKAYIGTVTDISSTTIQIRKFNISPSEKNGEIQQIATSSETVAVSVSKTTKSIKISDIAIGDFIIAMGYKNGNNVLDAKRILVTEEVKPAARSIISAKVTKVMKNTLEITTVSNEKLTLKQEDEIDIFSYSDGKPTRIKFPDIETGDSIFAVGEIDENSFSARTITKVGSETATLSPTPQASPPSAVKPTATPASN